MEIYLIRHTETICEKGICYGQSDLNIAEPFDEIFGKIISELPSKAMIFSSPLKRCSILAKHIQENVNTISYQEDDRLKEMNFGDWELKSWDEIPPEQLNPWMEDFVNIKVSNGESFVELHERVGDFLNEISLLENPIIIVSHAGVIRSILCHQTETPLIEAFKNKVNFGQVIRIKL
jgi:alpha-ribazole phosphatase